ncbi:MAG: hypothetical protein CML17_01085 [Pusillimonas sp.]|nr:hypothetical protein [Pusillimonas sp.]
MNPRLPKDKSLDGVLSRNPDPPPMNAGMPRGISLDAIKSMNARKRLMDMGPEEVMRLLGDTHEGDYRHLFDTETNPHAFRHGIQDAGADEIMQLLRELDLNKSFDTAWNVMKEDIISMSDIEMMVKEVHDLVQIQGAHPMQAAAMVAEANYPDQRKLGRTLFAEYVKMMS